MPRSGGICLKQNRKTVAGRERNDRLIAVPIKMPRFACFHKPSDLPLRWRQELEGFFLATTRFEGKDARCSLGWASAAEGERMVKVFNPPQNRPVRRRNPSFHLDDPE